MQPFLEGLKFELTDFFHYSILVRVELEKVGRQSRASCSIHDLLGHGQSCQIDQVAGFGQQCVWPVVGAH